MALALAVVVAHLELGVVWLAQLAAVEVTFPATTCKHPVLVAR